MGDLKILVDFVPFKASQTTIKPQYKVYFNTSGYTSPNCSTFIALFFQNTISSY